MIMQEAPHLFAGLGRDLFSGYRFFLSIGLGVWWYGLQLHGLEEE